MRVTSKGQVTIPKPVRDKLGIGPGSQVDFIERGDEVRLVRMNAAVRKAAVTDWLQSIRGTGQTGLTTNEIMDVTRGPFNDVDPR